jgi:isochorismate hydrolase
MEKYYLTKENISSKANEWLAKLNIPASRAKQFKFQPKNSALLVIDIQEFFLKEDSHAFLPAAKTIIPNINSLIDAYKKKDFPIIFTMHALAPNEKPGIMGRWWRDVPKLDSPLSKICSSIHWKKNDITLQKSRYSAFIGTNLDKILKDKKIDTLVITGIMTHLCCESTARDAFMRDYEVYFVIDATASYNETLHVSSLITLTNGFAIPVKTDTILKEVQHIE